VFGDRVQPGADLASTRDWIVEALSTLRDRLRGTGVEVWLETHGDFATAAASRALVEQAGCDGIGVVWDAANAFSEFGEAPEAGFATLGGFVRHVHLKDVRRPADGRIPGRRCSTGTGDFPAARTLELLRRARYDRWLSYEWEKRWHPAIEEPEVALPHFLGWASAELRQRKDEAPATGRPLGVGRMRIEVHEHRPARRRAAAAAVADEIRTLVSATGRPP
jgi:sugar phosphate isomerase/epimerase